MPNIRGAIIGWTLIGILAIITYFIVRWGARATQRSFDDYIKQKVYEVLDERENEYKRYEQRWEYEEQQRSQYYQSREVKPGSAEHYEKWKAERQNREP